MAGAELGDFIARAAAEPFRFGEWDCCMTVANWVWEATGADPAAALRRTYGEDGWPALVEDAGGMVALIGQVATTAGLTPTLDPRPGDIGVIETRRGPIAAIKVTRGWMFKLNDGVSVWPGTPLAAWRR